MISVGRYLLSDFWNAFSEHVDGVHLKSLVEVIYDLELYT